MEEEEYQASLLCVFSSALIHRFSLTNDRIFHHVAK